MALNKCVIVLTPNGRKQTVKVTPNTTILQILDEVCKKQGFKANDYDLKHHNNVLDTTAIMRFTGLPNNAQLEMCTIQRIRTETSVTLGIQLENGTRLTGTFSPSDTLWNVVETLCSEEKNSNNLVIIYMRNEMYGTEALKNTNLRSLGLTGGRAMCRLLHRTPEELKTQANVSSVLPVKPIEEKPYIRKLKQDETNQDVNIPTPDKFNQVTSGFSNNTPQENKNLDHLINDQPIKTKNKSKESIEFPTQQNPSINIEPEEYNKSKIDFVFLGERNAMAFSLEMSDTIPHEDLPDEFFELTIQDARKLYHDLKSKREELEERPLQTSELRNLEQSKKVLRQINQYQKSVIRIQFPDRTVLQGTFKPVETIHHVHDFVREYLHNQDQEFYLYTTPPKTILEPSKTLVDSDCVPSTVIYFGMNDLPEQGKFLKEDIFSKFVTPSTASIAASKLILKHKREIQVEDRRCSEEQDDVNAGASTSKAPSVLPPDEPKNKVPKWFQSTK